VQKEPCVYLLASQGNGTLYVGVTSGLIRRIWEHKSELVEGFTRRYRAHLLVWFEMHETMPAAIARQNAIKEWRRDWKLQLIEKTNPAWRDLHFELV
jgi:putative endonuclease